MHRVMCAVLAVAYHLGVPRHKKGWPLLEKIVRAENFATKAMAHLIN